MNKEWNELHKRLLAKDILAKNKIPSIPGKILSSMRKYVLQGLDVTKPVDWLGMRPTKTDRLKAMLDKKKV